MLKTPVNRGPDTEGLRYTPRFAGDPVFPVVPSGHDCGVVRSAITFTPHSGVRRFDVVDGAHAR